MELAFRHPTSYGEGCKCFTFQKRWLHLFSSIPCIWQIHFHKNTFALWVAIFWWKLLLKTSNAFTFCHLFKILILTMVWLSGVLEIATYCEVLVICCQEVQVCTEASSTATSQCITLACLNDLKTGFYFWRVTFKKNSSNKQMSQFLKKPVNFSITRRRGSLCFEKFGEEVFQSFHLFFLFVNDKR